MILCPYDKLDMDWIGLTQHIRDQQTIPSRTWCLNNISLIYWVILKLKIIWFHGWPLIIVSVDSMLYLWLLKEDFLWNKISKNWLKIFIKLSAGSITREMLRAFKTSKFYGTSLNTTNKISIFELKFFLNCYNNLNKYKVLVTSMCW